jgi:serine/threonine protein phosphatase PrpC
MFDASEIESREGRLDVGPFLILRDVILIICWRLRTVEQQASTESTVDKYKTVTYGATVRAAKHHLVPITLAVEQTTLLSFFHHATISAAKIVGFEVCREVFLRGIIHCGDNNMTSLLSPRIIIRILFAYLLCGGRTNHVGHAWFVEDRRSTNTIHSGSLRSHAPTTAPVNSPCGRGCCWEYTIGSATLPGTDPERPQKVNQDGHFFFRGTTTTFDADTRIVAMGVMDGHGLKGHQVVQFLQRQLPVRLQQYLGHLLLEDGNSSIADTSKEFMDLFEQQTKDLIELGKADPAELQQAPTGNVPQALVHAFLATQLDARRDTSIPTGRSGTTCVVCLAVENTNPTGSGCSLILHTAYVGDSRAIHWASGGNPNDGTVTCLTRATTVGSKVERDRIERCQGRIDIRGNVFYGPVGIAMTRSLGNAVMLRAGVLPIPMLTQNELHRGQVNPKSDSEHGRTDAANFSHYICAGTDGVFDVLSNEQVMNIIDESVNDESSSSLNAAANEVCRQAREAWLAELPIETKVDDITCVILRCSAGGNAI